MLMRMFEQLLNLFIGIARVLLKNTKVTVKRQDDNLCIVMNIGDETS